VRHVVKPGETLGGIARKYQVKVGDIATANNISDPAKIRPGVELVIPGWQAPAAKPAAAPATSAPADASPAPAQPAPDAIPTIVIPAPGQDDSVKPAGGEPPIIPVDDNPQGGR
jgi:hypothetical protein